MKQKLIVNPRRCTGCGQCISVCSAVKTGLFWPKMARLVIHTNSRKGFSTPIVCLQCEEDAWCQNACKFEAIARNMTTGAITIDSEACTGCKMCVAACPYDVIGFDESQNVAIKCDLCEGEPHCVEACYSKAIKVIAYQELTPSEFVSQTRK